jgi:hypothetical protein
MDSNTHTDCGGCFILFVVFMVLKLTKTIAWSWWWVSAPLWIPFAIFLVVVGFVVFVKMLDSMFSDMISKKKIRKMSKIEKKIYGEAVKSFDPEMEKAEKEVESWVKSLQNL